MIATFISALVPLLIGFVWYNEKVFGKVWMKECGFTAEYLKANFNPLKVFGLLLLFSVMLSFVLNAVVIHQSGISSLLLDKKRLTVEQISALESVKISTANLYRDFGHGALHGIIAAVFIALPVIGINALFEKRSFKYILIHVGYWIVCLAIMGGILCQWSKLD